MALAVRRLERAEPVGWQAVGVQSLSDATRDHRPLGVSGEKALFVFLIACVHNDPEAPAVRCFRDGTCAVNTVALPLE